MLFLWERTSLRGYDYTQTREGTTIDRWGTQRHWKTAYRFSSAMCLSHRISRRTRRVRRTDSRIQICTSTTTSSTPTHIASRASPTGSGRLFPPVLFQHVFPQMLKVTHGQGEVHTCEKELLDYYCRAVNAADPVRLEVMDNPSASLIKRLASLVPACWDHKNLSSLRNALIEVVACWDDVTGHQGVPCPISFTEKKLLQHQDEMELVEGVSAIMRQLDDEGLVPYGGVVRPEYYERAREVNDHFKRVFVELAENERQRELHARVWPYQ